MRLMFPTFFLLVVFAGCDKDSNTTNPVAQVLLSSIEQVTDSTYNIETGVIGSAIFLQKGNATTVKIELEGLTPGGVHAVHMHMGSCDQPGHHWNQGSTESFCNVEVLGELWARPKAGDVGNVVIGADGRGSLEVSSDLWTVGSGQASDIEGLVMIVHAFIEEFDQECFQPHDHMHNNPKIACGQIEVLLND